MKSAIVVCVLGVAALALARPGEEEPSVQYTDKYDNVNLDEVLSNHKILLNYINCILEKGKCTPDGKELKSNIPDALENDCAKCTPAQKAGTKKVITHLIKFEPDFWNELKAKYDPKGLYEKNHADDLKDL